MNENQILAKAKSIIRARKLRRGAAMKSPNEVKEHFAILFAELKNEVFGCLFLDARHQVIAYRDMFFGTVDGASVHPRPVVMAALELNAAAVVFAHNHPSGCAEPSRADVVITRRLTEALALVDVKVLDHLVLGDGDAVSLAERGTIPS